MPRTELCTLLDGKTVPQQHYFEAYLAQRLQEPSKPPLMAILLRGEHGTGKNFWIDNIMKHLLGDSNCVSVGLNDLTGRNTKDLYQTLLVHVEEMNDTRHKAGDKMKKLITEETARTEAKFMNATVETKYFGIIASSNVLTQYVLKAMIVGGLYPPTLNILITVTKQRLSLEDLLIG